MKNTIFSHIVQTSRPDHLFLVRAKDGSGKAAWYYIAVDKGKRDMFASCGGVSSLNLLEYGRIITSGFGDNPPDLIADMMAEEYEFQE